MIQKDLIQRFLEDISRFIAKVLRLKGEAALEYIYEVFSTELKLDAEYLAGLTPANILQKLTEEKGFSVHQLEFVAEVLAKEGTTLHKLNRIEESIDKLEKALIIFNFVEEEEKLFSLERKITMQKLEKLLTEPQK